MKTIKRDIKIKATDGKRLIYKNPIFIWVDSDFDSYGLNYPEKETKETLFEIKEIEKNVTFEEIYESLGVDLDKLVVTQGQILDFTKFIDNNEYYCFLLKRDNFFFVAYVRRHGRELEALVLRFELGYSWLAGFRYRLVLPQLDTLSFDPMNPKPFDSLEKRVTDLESKVVKLTNIINI